MILHDYLVLSLKRMGVTCVFGYPGSAVMSIIEAIGRESSIKYVQNYHEQASAFAADGYSRFTGKIGVALATSGPGATNLVTGIANSFMDSTPVLYITGQENTKYFKNSNARSSGFQDLDIVQVVKSITKYAATVHSASEFPGILSKAFRELINGRPGPVLIDIPIDIQFDDIPEGSIDYEFVDSTVQNIRNDISDYICKLHDAITVSKKPLCVLGGGVRISKAVDSIKRFFKITNIPFVTTLNGLDSIEGSIGFAGIYGSSQANAAIEEADLLIAMGTRFGLHHVGKNPDKYTMAKVIHIDIDKEELARVFKSSTIINADLDYFISEYTKLYDNFDHYVDSDWPITHTLNLIDKNIKLENNVDGPVVAIQELLNLSSADSIITGDVGLNQMWLAKAYRHTGNRRLLNSTGLGAMGYSLPAAIGVSIANPDLQVISFTGDGGLFINLQELLYLEHKKCNVKVVVINNKTLGMISALQNKFYNGSDISTGKNDFANPDIKRLAYGFNLKYLMYEVGFNESDLDSILKSHGPCIIEIKVDPVQIASTKN